VLRATAVYLFVAVYVMVMAPVAMLWIFTTGDTRFAYEAGRWCIRAACFLAGVRVRLRGLDNIRPGQNYFFLSNHQSNADGLVLTLGIPRDIRGVVKAEMMRIPILSTLLKQVRFLPMPRSDPKRARSILERGAQLLREGYSFFAFPEGTRSRDGHLGKFKGGVFAMAIMAGTPVLPVTIRGTGAIQRPGAYAIAPADVEIVFHEPIATGGMQVTERERLMERTRAAIALELPQ
jgi:1-acyl-sn-glycerol-3-phosphate acyltransferase